MKDYGPEAMAILTAAPTTRTIRPRRIELRRVWACGGNTSGGGRGRGVELGHCLGQPVGEGHDSPWCWSALVAPATGPLVARHASGESGPRRWIAPVTVNAQVLEAPSAPPPVEAPALGCGFRSRPSNT